MTEVVKSTTKFPIRVQPGGICAAKLSSHCMYVGMYVLCSLELQRPKTVPKLTQNLAATILIHDVFEEQ